VAQALDAYDQLKGRLKLRLVDLLDETAELPRAIEQRQRIEQQLRRALETLLPDYPGVQLEDHGGRLLREVVEELLGYGPLDALLDDPTINEVMVNAPDEIYVERQGRIERADARFRDLAHLMTVIERMLASVNQSVSEANPICDAMLKDGTRLNVIVPPLVYGSPTVTMRRRYRDWTMADYLANGSISQEAVEFLAACIKAKVNMVISGGTTTAKTTLVNILATFIAPEERIITIENVWELQLPGKHHWVRLASKPPNAEGRGEVPLRILVRNALRMRPDRIILGEARGGEALDVVQAMQLGHDGFMTVLHANNPHAALERLQTLMLMSGLDISPAVCRLQVASAVDLVVHMARFPDGSRRVATIAQVRGSSEQGFEMENLFTLQVKGFSPDGRLDAALQYTGASPRFLEKFRLNNVEVPAWVKT
jgi:pilus assembly protein CpaF